MSNILCGLDILEDSEIINVIAIMEKIHKINENVGIKKTGKRILRFASYFTSIFKESDSDSLSEYDNLNLYIENTTRELSALSKEQLIKKFKDSLREILYIDNEVSEDDLCLKLTDSACNFLKINKDKMPLYKAKKVYEKYFNLIKARFTDYIYKMEDSYSKYKTINKDIIFALNKGFSIEKNLLFSKDFIASNKIDVAISETLVFITFLLSAFSLDRIYPNISEFKVSYNDKFEKEFNDLLLSIKNSNTHVMANNQKIISLKHDLRGFSLKAKREEKKKNDCIENLNKLKLSKENLAKDIEKQEHELEIKKKDFEIKSSEIDKLDENSKMNMENEIFKLERRINILKNKLKNTNNEGQYAAKSLEHITSELSIANNKMKETNVLLEEMELKGKEFAQSIDSDKANFENKCKERLNIIKHRWIETFKDFTIKDEVYSSINNFNSSELLKVEMALLEMSKMSDVSSISIGKIDKFYDYVILNTSKREPIKIFFEVSSFGTLVKIEKIEKDLVII